MHIRNHHALIGSLALMALASGCATGPKDLTPEMMLANCQRTDAVVQESQAQLAALRSEMATVKIGVAKKEAEIHALRQELETLRAASNKLRMDHSNHQRVLDTKEEEVKDLQRDRDRLAQEVTVLQARLETVPAPSMVAAEAPVLQTHLVQRLEALEVSIKTLNQQMTQLARVSQSPLVSGDRRQERKRYPARTPGVSPAALPGHDKFTGRVGIESGTAMLAGGSSIHVLVQRGDTLGKFARRFGVTVEAIRDANGLESDLILVGQRLLIPGVFAPY